MIYLVRHGKPNIGHWGRVTGLQFCNWISAYNSCALDPESKPSSTLVKAIQSNSVFICSTLSRSIESSRALCCSEEVTKDDLYREFEMPCFHIPYLKMSPGKWAIVFRLLWAVGITGGVESFRSARQRVKKASLNIGDLHESGQDVVLVGHELFNRFLERVLIKDGWSSDKIEIDDKYWSCVRLSKPD